MEILYVAVALLGVGVIVQSVRLVAAQRNARSYQGYYESQLKQTNRLYDAIRAKGLSTRTVPPAPEMVLIPIEEEQHPFGYIPSFGTIGYTGYKSAPLKKVTKKRKK